MNVENFEHKLSTLDRNLSDWHSTTSKRVRLMTDKILDYAQYLEEDRRAQAIVAEAHMREVKAIEDLVVQKVEQEMQARRESEARMQAMIEDRFAGLRAEVCRESRARYEAVE